MIQKFRKWCQFKNVYEKEKAEILAIEDKYKRQEELDKPFPEKVLHCRIIECQRNLLIRCFSK